MKALVTGGAGFIGSHLVEALLKHNHYVRVLDDLSSGSSENLSACLSSIEFIQEDIQRERALLEAARGMEVIFHLAAVHSVQESMEDPLRYQQVNALGTLGVLRAAESAGKIRVVNISSSAIYGNQASAPFHEEMEPLPLSPYGASKLVAEIYCSLFSRSYGIPTVSLRLFNVYGPRQPLEGDYAKVIPKFFRQISQDQSPTIYGNGTQARDFVYVEDVVQAALAAATTSQGIGEAFNVGEATPHTVLEVAEKMNEALGKKHPPLFLPPPPGEAQLTLADITKARQKLGFIPNVSFAEGIRKTVQWWQTQGHARTVR